jgi:hypothetical protein
MPTTTSVACIITNTAGILDHFQNPHVARGREEGIITRSTASWRYVRIAARHARRHRVKGTDLKAI